ncbi:MAG: carboxypeptidase-like regulatory domain-containing protein, partial [Cytophagales bacterium]|nr:carboxypeptidase-like regulatory domain-containing protein [Cytophagales bacterium]
MIRKLLFTCVFALLSFGMAWAQKIQVTGRVTDSTGEGVPGATIQVRGTTNGVSADFDGNYSIKVADKNAILIISSIGYASQEVAVGNKTVINITLSEDTQQLNEVVVVGYSERKKQVITSAVATITDVKGLTPSTSIDNMLQGKATGVDATALNGKPGQTATVKIRGAVSLNVTGGDKSQPLYVIDGVFLSEEDLNAINPNDIESMVVLKDAASAAIYGSRGANGVIVVTTKGGKKNTDASISFSTRLGFAKKVKDDFDMMNAAQLIQYEEELAAIRGNEAPYTPEERKAMIAMDHDWKDDILKTAQ